MHFLSEENKNGQTHTQTQIIGHLIWEPHYLLVQNLKKKEKSNSMRHDNTAYCSRGVPLPELGADHILPYGQSCLFCSVGRGFFLRKLSRLGPWRPRGSSGGMNLDRKKRKNPDMTDCGFHHFLVTNHGCCIIMFPGLHPGGVICTLGPHETGFRQKNRIVAYLSFTKEYMRSLSSMHFFHSGLSPWRSR